MSPLLLLLFLITTTTAATEQCNPQDKAALLLLKKSFNNSQYFQRWSPTTDCCTWESSVTCSPTTNRVTSLSIYNFPPISGPFPPSISNLTFLTSLDIRKLPNLTGPLPFSLSSLSNLQFLRLDFNSLSGPIPDFLHRLLSLTYLNLSFNKFSGSIPQSLALAPNLDFLHLDRNRLTGPIPDKFRSGSMFRLDLSHNRLSGSLPQALGEVNFTMLQLARNDFSGDASLLFGKEKPLSELDLSRNSFEFDFGVAGEEIPLGIEWLILDHNRIFGRLPESMAGLRFLNNLNVSYNRLCGKIPTGWKFGEFYFWSQEQSFDESAFLHNKCLCGSPLPDCT